MNEICRQYGTEGGGLTAAPPPSFCVSARRETQTENVTGSQRCAVLAEEKKGDFSLCPVMKTATLPEYRPAV